MRHNQNARRPQRGRGNGGGHGGGHHHNSGQQNGRRVNPRVQTFDSNGPEVRIRGTAYQINEKYIALARDAAAAGDRILAESYLQHAEHYQRFINEMTEEYNLYQQQNPQHNQHHQQQHNGGAQPQPQADGAAPAVDGAAVVSSMNDLDQGFLVGRGNGAPQANGHDAAASQPAAEQGHQQPRPPRENRPPRRVAEGEAG